MMFEPTETESRDTLDTFAKDFAQVLKVDAETLHEAPITTPVRRVDEVYAARNLCLKHPFDEE
jgi:glycine dehydrogenase subunit 2